MADNSLSRKHQSKKPASVLQQEDDLRKYGKSKEHRPNPIVSMGLFMDTDGIPLAFDIFPGNQNDPARFVKTTSVTDDGEIAEKKVYTLDLDKVRNEEK